MQAGSYIVDTKYDGDYQTECFQYISPYQWFHSSPESIEPDNEYCQYDIDYKGNMERLEDE